MKEFSERLKSLRLERELSLDMVVYDINNRFDLGITKSHLSRWENGKYYPSLRYAAYLALYYNVSLDYLIGLTDVRTPRIKVNKEDILKEVAFTCAKKVAFVDSSTSDRGGGQTKKEKRSISFF